LTRRILVVGVSVRRSDLVEPSSDPLQPGMGSGGDLVPGAARRRAGWSGKAERIGDLALGVFELSPGGGDGVVSAERDQDPELTEQSAQGVDASGALGEPSGAEAVERGESLLSNGLDRDGSDLLVAVGLEHTFGVGAVGLVAADVGAHSVRGQQDGLVPESEHAAGPEVGPSRMPP